MELEEFLEKFLPDYKSKFDKEMALAPDFDGCYSYDAKELWVFNNLFPEAIQNFADRIYEEQRKKCCDEYRIEKKVFQNVKDILNVPQPKIEDL